MEDPTRIPDGPGVAHRVGTNDMLISLDRLHELVYQAAGAATGPLLRDHPDYEFPSEDVSAAVGKVMDEFKIPKVDGYKR